MIVLNIGVFIVALVLSFAAGWVIGRLKNKKEKSKN